MSSKELFDRTLCFVAVVLLSPVLLLIGLTVFLETGFPILFKHRRVGRNGKPFLLLKFRTMRAGKSGPSITVGGDSRVTKVGLVLRKFKLDELPQLWNVVRGDMSLVGPRPEVPEFVDMQNPIWRSVLRVRPGITDPASITYRNEEALLAKASNPIEFYEKHVLPSKLAMNLAYLEKQSFWLDLKVIFQTARCAMFPGAHEIKENGV